jgi:hypothetical protein
VRFSPPAFLRRWKPTVSFIATQKRRKLFSVVRHYLRPDLRNLEAGREYE